MADLKVGVTRESYNKVCDGILTSGSKAFLSAVGLELIEAMLMDSVNWGMNHVKMRVRLGYAERTHGGRFRRFLVCHFY